MKMNNIPCHFPVSSQSFEIMWQQEMCYSHDVYYRNIHIHIHEILSIRGTAKSFMAQKLEIDLSFPQKKITTPKKRHDTT